MAKLTNRYANALLELSEERGTLERDLEHVFFIRQALSGADVQAFLVHNNISDSVKTQLFQKLFSQNVSDELMGFLYLMVKKSRESLILPVLSEYVDCANKRLGKIEARLVSAKALTDEQVESVRSVLARKTNKKISIKADVDPSVIGGFYVQMGDYIFDSTVRSELNSFKEHLKRGSKV